MRWALTPPFHLFPDTSVGVVCFLWHFLSPASIARYGILPVRKYDALCCPDFPSLALLPLFSGCHKDPQQTCGCESPTLNTLSNTRGLLSYNSFDNHYYISTFNLSTSPVQGPYYSVLICNPNIAQLDAMLQPNKNVVRDTVVFGGQTKKLCDSERLPGAGWPVDKVIISSIAISH